MLKAYCTYLSGGGLRYRNVRVRDGQANVRAEDIEVINTVTWPLLSVVVIRLCVQSRCADR